VAVQRKEYEVTINDLPHTLLLSDEDAKHYKTAKLVKRESAPKAATPANKAASPDENK
jgi:hypothetical protein